MNRDRGTTGRSQNCGISIPSDTRCNKATSDNQALCQLSPVSNRCEFAKIPGKNRKYTLKGIQALLSAPASGSEVASVLVPPVSDHPTQPDDSHHQSRAFRMDNATLRVAVAEWNQNRALARGRYGHISTWNTTDVTDMSGLFCKAPFVSDAFNDALGDWDTRNVTTMSGMFFATQLFDQPLNAWDTRNVVDMSNMFSRASRFNQPLDKWNTSKVRSMRAMFAGAARFSQKLDTWTTGNVQDMCGMFSRADRFNQKLGTWKTGNVLDMSLMFSYTKFNQKVDAWDTSRVTSMEGMFCEASAFNQPLDRWNTSRVRDMSQMFAAASKFDKPLHAWDTRHVTTMKGMFRESKFNQPIGRWNTGQVTSMAGMFFKSHFNQPLREWDTSRVLEMNHMFSYAHRFDQRLGDWNTGQVTSMAGMFSRSKFNQPIGGWDTRNVTDMHRMFCEATTFNQPLHNWRTGNVTDMSCMFEGAVVFDQPLDHFTTGQVVDMSSMFHRASAFNQPIGDWDTSHVVDMRMMFYRALAFNQPIGGWQTGRVLDMLYMFFGAMAFNQSLETWELHEDLFMHNMFDKAPWMLQRHPKGQLPRRRYATGELWGKVRSERRSLHKRLRFKWQALCDVSSGVSVDVLRGLALEAGIPSAATLSRRELCAAFSRRWSSQADDLATALPDCTNERGLMQYPVAYTPPEFFYRYTHDGKVYCDDIRHLYEHVRHSTKNPYTNLPYSQQIIDDIRATYRRLEATTRSMADFDEEDEELVSFASNLTRKLAELMSKLYYPNNADLFRGASEVHFSVFVQSLHAFGVISANERARVEDQSTLDERKALLVDLLILKIDQDPDRQETSHGPVSRVAYEVSDVYNSLFI
jgi:hypothetical protein